MTLTRWKLLTGTFGLAVCGIAALAEPACQKSKQNTDAVAQANCSVPPPVPLTIPLPMPAPLPEMLTVVPTPLAVPAETAPAPRLAVTTPADAPPVNVALPTLVMPLPPVRTPEKTVSAAELAQFIQEAANAGEPVAQPIPAITLPAVVSTPPMPAPVAVPAPVQAPPLPPVQAMPVPAIVEGKPVATVQTTGYVAPSASVSSEKKFKVLLQMGDTLPKFEIRDGEDVLLKVVADKVDVKSPAERSELWATLKASGQVKFVTPGGEGLCDQLEVIPGSGEVVASGSVKFTYNWGKVETAVTSERMTFRLGSAPALAHGEKR